MGRPVGYKHTEETKLKISNSATGALSSQWKGDDIKYTAIHSWLIRHFGRADICENLVCPGTSKTYDWALIKGKPYARIRASFWKLCRSCHRKYDMTDEVRSKISVGMKAFRAKERI